MSAFSYKGRDVSIGVVSFGDLLIAQEASENSGKSVDAMWSVLIKAATYSDDGTLVFASVDDILAAPATEAARIMAMSAEASRLNFPAQDKTDPSP